MHISHNRLDTEFLNNVSLADISELFGLPLAVEKKLDAVLSTYVASDVKPLAVFIHKVIVIDSDCLTYKN